MSSCTYPETGELMDGACDDCRGIGRNRSERRGTGKLLKYQRRGYRTNLMRRRKLERKNRKAARK